ncbi:hypothetical protein ASU33_03030 [Solirubrum puertoriconensis]|uniref:Outer membrane protein beta-barrel domain-containing protein n=1 Tax=Solirubrum puertoriconensis TaxID=1751427 RepID=A0A9X0HI37_SOLP1|nr:hypothetical protein ASU33_03030 [Solirubrum puertoriconensis]
MATSPVPTANSKPPTKAQFNGTDGYDRFDVGYVAGVGYQLSSGPTLGVRNNSGITRATGTARNSVFQLFVGYTFGSN